MKPKNSIKGIDSKMIRHYLDTRKVIDERADRISNIAHLFNLVKFCNEDTIPMSTHALTFFSGMIYSDICMIIESLDGFIDILDAESVLNESED